MFQEFDNEKTVLLFERELQMPTMTEKSTFHGSYCTHMCTQFTTLLSKKNESFHNCVVEMIKHVKFNLLFSKLACTLQIL